MPATHTLDLTPLPRGMVWIDEHDWVPAQHATEYSITGALLVDAYERLAGRPITLQAQDDAGWIRRDALAALYGLASDPGATYTLTLADGRVFSVMFAPEGPIEARPVGRPELPGPDNPYIATVRLIEIAP